MYHHACLDPDFGKKSHSFEITNPRIGSSHTELITLC